MQIAPFDSRGFFGHSARVGHGVFQFSPDHARVPVDEWPWMRELARRTGLSVRLVRTSIEATALAIGWLLGGTVGVGTVVYALVIGPLTQLLLPTWTVPVGDRPDPV